MIEFFKIIILFLVSDVSEHVIIRASLHHEICELNPEATLNTMMDKYVTQHHLVPTGATGHSSLKEPNLEDHSNIRIQILRLILNLFESSMTKSTPIPTGLPYMWPVVDSL